MDQQNENQAMLHVADAEWVYGGVTYVISVHQQSDGCMRIGSVRPAKVRVACRFLRQFWFTANRLRA